MAIMVVVTLMLTTIAFIFSTFVDLGAFACPSCQKTERSLKIACAND